MKSRLLTFAGCIAVLLALAKIYEKPLLAQVRAALVQNVDEPARNPYQESFFSYLGNCPAGNQFCNFNYSAVPAGKRLVITNISGYVDVTGGSLPNGTLGSSLGGNQYAQIFFTGTREYSSASSTRIVVNQQIRAYFGPGETPHLFAGLNGSTDSFAGAGSMSLSGYYVSL